MDLFALDRQVIVFIQKLLTDPMTQFTVLAAIGVIVSGIFPDSKSTGSNKK